MNIYVAGTTYRRVAPRNHWVPSPTVGDDQIINWWKLGQDTYAIAVFLNMPEHEVERRLHLAKDASRRDQEWNWPPESKTKSESSEGA